MFTIPEILDTFKHVSNPMLQSLHTYLEPYAAPLPDRRFASTLYELVPGMLAARSPQISQAAAHAPHREVSSWSRAKCGYRLRDTPQFSHRDWLKVLYADARRVAEAAARPRVIVALDPINFEHRYATVQEGLSVVWKSTPPGSLPKRKARLTPGYPALIAYTVNLPQPTVPYARVFSYTQDFLSENVEIYHALRTLRVVLNRQRVCVVTDAGLDDRKFYAECDRLQVECVTRAAGDRWIDVFNLRLQRWEREHLVDLVASLPGQFGFSSTVTHAGKTTSIHVILDWFQCRLPDTQQPLWVVVTSTDYFADPLVLITNRPVHDVLEAQVVYRDWLLRPSIEHFYRFIQEDGLDIETIRLEDLESHRRSFTLVLSTALFVLRLPDLCAPAVVLWLRLLGSSTTGTAMDRHGPYALLRGLQMVLAALAVLSSLAHTLLRHLGFTVRQQLYKSTYG